MIGIFDSGSGGLTVLKAIREEMPSADVLYFGDIKNAPYGSRSRGELSRLTFAGLKLLIDQGATRIVSACNTASASLAVSIFDASDLAPDRFIDMVGPTVAYFRNTSAKLALVATPATVESEAYQNAFAMLGKEVAVAPIPELAGAIEFGKSEEEIERIIKSALAELPAGFNVLILACTHYPLVRHIFERVVGKGVLVFDPAVAVAGRVKKAWWPQEVGEGTARLLISQDSEPFRCFVAETLGESPYTVQVVS